MFTCKQTNRHTLKLTIQLYTNRQNFTFPDINTQFAPTNFNVHKFIPGTIFSVLFKSAIRFE